jgi:hypothetical protein
MYVSKFRQKLIFAPEVPNQMLPPQHTSVHSASALLSLCISSDVKSARHPNRMDRNFGQAKTQRKLVMTNSATPIGRDFLVRKEANEETQETSCISDGASPTFAVSIYGCRSSAAPDLINRVVPAPVQRLHVLTDKFANATSKF